MDLEKKVVGGTFTRVRVDRCLFNPEWSLALPSTSLAHKTAASSDHVPILLTLREMHACKVGSRAFKYETMWERDESFFTTVNGRWTMQAADSVVTLHAKLEGLAGDLSAWDHTQFGSVWAEIRHLKMLSNTCILPKVDPDLHMRKPR